MDRSTTAGPRDATQSEHKAQGQRDLVTGQLVRGGAEQTDNDDDWQNCCRSDGGQFAGSMRFPPEGHVTGFSAPKRPEILGGGRRQQPLPLPGHVGRR